MTKKANKHEQPEMYRILMRCGDWAMASERYYTAYHSSEALEDLYHAFHKGRVHAKKITISDIQEYCRYSNIWISRIEKAIENIDDFDPETIKIKNKKIIIRRG